MAKNERLTDIATVLVAVGMSITHSEDKSKESTLIIVGNMERGLQLAIVHAQRILAGQAAPQLLGTPYTLPEVREYLESQEAQLTAVKAVKTLIGGGLEPPGPWQATICWETTERTSMEVQP
jgi:hypothetical protein